MDRKKVISGAPWNFNNDLIVLEEPKEVGVFLGNLIGNLEDTDMGATGDWLDNFMRGRVNIDINKTLKRALRVSLDGETLTILLQYERLPSFCTHCGCLGHVVGTCPATKEGEMLPAKFGVWLKVGAPTDRGKGRWSRNDEQPPRTDKEKKGDSAGTSPLKKECRLKGIVLLSLLPCL
ncbi:hypothetical protein ACOSP7_006682 [Xanthoceras sorbifolium]